jgi:hypothetical protein
MGDGGGKGDGEGKGGGGRRWVPFFPCATAGTLLVVH